MSKTIEYQKLIVKRQEFKLPQGLSNYGDIGLEINHVDAWEAWHSDLDAEIMVVGQDFADVKTFRKDRGRIEPKDESFIYPTNKNLNYLFEEGLGIKIGHPSRPNKAEKLLFTNALIGLKTEGGMQGKIKAHWVVDSAVNFLKPLIDIVNPKIIIALGQIPFQAIYSVFKKDIKPTPFMNVPLKEHVGKFYSINNRIKVFPVYHCGARGVKINRELKDQVKDWKKIRQAISS